MKSTVIAMFIILALLAGLAFSRGTDTLMLGVRNSIYQLLRFLPLLVIAMFMTGFAEVLLPPNLVENWLSDSSGWRGILIAWIAGILTPGGSIIGLPIVATLYKSGVGISILMTYATSFALLSILRIPIEVGFIGWKLAGLRVAVSLFLPLLAGVSTQLLLPLIKRP